MTLPKGLVMMASCTLGCALLYLVFLSVIFLSGVFDTVQPAEQNTAVTGYLFGQGTQETQLAFLTQREQEHMADVRDVLSVAFVLFLFSVGSFTFVVLTYAILHRWETLEELLGRSLQSAGQGILGTSFLIGAAAWLNFDAFWAILHVFLFPGGNWAFPAASTLITLYPATFFRSFTMVFTVRAVLIALAVWVLGWWLLRSRLHERVFTGGVGP